MFLTSIYHIEEGLINPDNIRYQCFNSKKDALLYSLNEALNFHKNVLNEHLNFNKEMYNQNIIDEINNFIFQINNNDTIKIPYYFTYNYFNITFSIKEIKEYGEVIDTINNGYYNL